MMDGHITLLSHRRRELKVLSLPRWPSGCTAHALRSTRRLDKAKLGQWEQGGYVIDI